jgi:hypothetical protein
MLGAGGGSGKTLPSRSAEGLDGFHVVGRWFLDTCNGSSKSCCGINDSDSDCYLRDRDGMMFELERVGDPLTACVDHENPNAWIVICGM